MIRIGKRFRETMAGTFVAVLALVVSCPAHCLAGATPASPPAAHCHGDGAPDPTTPEAGCRPAIAVAAPGPEVGPAASVLALLSPDFSTLSPLAAAPVGGRRRTGHEPAPPPLHLRHRALLI